MKTDGGCKGEENPGGGFSDRKESATRGSNRIEMQRPEADAMQRGVEGVRARVAYPLNEQVATEAPKATETPVGTGRYMVFFLMYIHHSRYSREHNIHHSRNPKP